MRNLAFCFIMLNFTLNAFAFYSTGDTRGNGGGAWACFSQNDELIKVEILDIYEAKERGLEFGEAEMAKNIEARVLRRLGLVSKNFLALYLKSKLDFHKNKHYFFNKLSSTHDYGNLLPPETSWCPDGTIKFVQIINYSAYGDIFFNKAIYEMLSPFSINALLVHEVIYSLRRKLFLDLTSVDSREVVALLLADNLSDWQAATNIIQFFKGNNSLELFDQYNYNWLVPPRETTSNVISTTDLRYSLPISIWELSGGNWKCKVNEGLSLLKLPDSFSISKSGWFRHSLASVLKLNGLEKFKIAEIEINVRSHFFSNMNTIIESSDDQTDVDLILLRRNNGKIVFEIISKKGAVTKSKETSLFLNQRKVLGYGHCISEMF
jgi:hypothetical protein